MSSLRGPSNSRAIGEARDILRRGYHALVTAIWNRKSDTWQLVEPIGFPDEATLHSLVEQAPHVLPLAGNPDLVVVGREVRLGTGYADLVAIESSGRPVIIEVKLARNSEARRAVVAQVLAYAAHAHKLSVDEFEKEVLGQHLATRGFESILDAVSSQNQASSIRADQFGEALSENLAAGQFRIVLVLDSAPEELIQVAGFLDEIASELVVDLVTVGQYRIGGEDVIVPQRVDPGRSSITPAAPTRASESGYSTKGEDDFREAIKSASVDQRPQLELLTDWAVAIRDEGLVTLETYHGKNRLLLLPRMQPENVGLVTIWNDGGAYLQFWRSVFERRAPAFIDSVEAAIAPSRLGQGTTSNEIAPEVLDILTEAYRAAAGTA